MKERSMRNREKGDRGRESSQRIVAGNFSQ